MKKINYEEFIEKTKSRSAEINVPFEYTKKILEIKYPLIEKNFRAGAESVISFENSMEEDYFFKNIIKEALTLEGLYKTADIKGINPKYITRQLNELVEYNITPKSWMRKKSIKEKGDLYKLDKKATDKIINKALEMQKKEEKGLVSKLRIILGASISLLGLFFLSSNITGNAVGNLTIPTSNIIGTILFIGGLGLTLLFFKKR